MRLSGLLAAIVLASVVLGSASSVTAAEKRPPNVVLILIDDMGWADIGANGSTFHQTPNIDKLASQGMRFTSGYAACPVCSPTRASIMTGRWPARLHITDWLPGRKDMPSQKLRKPAIIDHIPPTEVTIAEALKSAGYATASIGKWHLGGKGHLPEDNGFDLNLGGTDKGSPSSYFSPYKIPNLPDGPAGEYLTDRLTDEAIKFIDVNKEKPFFVYLPHFTVHIPLGSKPELTEKYKGLIKPEATQSNAIYAGMIDSLDQGVGRIMTRLEELKLADNTIVIFTSDNGGLSVKEGPNTPATNNAPLRAGKGYLYEGGIRVPLIVRWPGVIKAGGVTDVPAVSADFFATLTEAAGVKLDHPTDGVSLLPLLRGDGTLPARPLFWHYPHYSNQGGKPGAAIREGDFKLIEFYEDNHVELYNVKNDLGEKTDLAAKMPEKVTDLRQKLGDWRKSIGAQMMTPNPDYKPAAAKPEKCTEAENENE